MHNHINVYSDIPVKFEDRREIVPVTDFQEGEPILTSGYCEKIEEKPASTAPVLVVTLNGQGGRFWIKYFHYTQWHVGHFHTGQRIYIWGTPVKDRNMWTFFHPSVPQEIGKIYPIYNLRAGETSVSKRDAVSQALDTELRRITEEVPGELLARRGLPPITDALQAIHTPSEMPEKRHFLRIAYREIFQLKKTPSFSTGGNISPLTINSEAFFQKLPHPPTEDQKSALQEIKADLQTAAPMRRLLTGDRGTGKTEVATALAYEALTQGKRVSIMVHSKNTAQRYEKNLSSTDLHRAAQAKTPHSNSKKLSITTFANHDPKGRYDLLISDEGPLYGPAQTARLSSSTTHHLQLTSCPISSTTLKVLRSIFKVSTLANTCNPRNLTTIVTAVNNINHITTTIDRMLAEKKKILIICKKNQGTTKHPATPEAQETFWQKRYEADCITANGKASDKKAAIERYAAEDGPLLLIADYLPEIPAQAIPIEALVVASAESYPLSRLHQIRTAYTVDSQDPICFIMADTQLAAHEMRPIENLYDPTGIAEIDTKRRTPQGGYIISPDMNPFALPIPSIYATILPWVEEDIATCQSLGILPDNPHNDKQAIDNQP